VWYAPTSLGKADQEIQPQASAGRLARMFYGCVIIKQLTHGQDEIITGRPQPSSKQESASSG